LTTGGTMSSQSAFWTADTISAAGTALSALLAAGVFAYDRASAWSRRRSDSSRLSQLIAGDLGLEIAQLRSISAFTNGNAEIAGYSNGLGLLSAKPGAEAALLVYLKQFNTTRIDRICETTNVFDAGLSDRLSLIITLRAGALMSVETMESMEPDQDRADVAKHVCLQVNALQRTMIEVFNAIIASRGVRSLQVECLISS